MLQLRQLQTSPLDDFWSNWSIDSTGDIRPIVRNPSTVSLDSSNEYAEITEDNHEYEQPNVQMNNNNAENVVIE